MKIALNVAFECLKFGIFHKFLPCLVTLFDHKLQGFQKQNENATLFARNVESDLFCDFQTQCVKCTVKHDLKK